MPIGSIVTGLAGQHRMVILFAIPKHGSTRGDSMFHIDYAIMTAAASDSHRLNINQSSRIHTYQDGPHAPRQQDQFYRRCCDKMP